MHLMFAVSGYSGIGKDEFCKRLVSHHNAIHTGMADTPKRQLAEVYGFSRDQLFGSSRMRNAGDLRYMKPLWATRGLVLLTDEMREARDGKAPENRTATWSPEKPVPWWVFRTKNRSVAGEYPNWPAVPPDWAEWDAFIQEGDPRVWLSPREALMGYCEKMNELYGDTWVRIGIKDHMRLAETVEVDGRILLKYRYDRMIGIAERSFEYVPSPNREVGDAPIITCFSDFRHKHELTAFRRVASEELRPILIRLVSKRVPKPPYQHRSETEQADIPNESFDYVVRNEGTVEQLHAAVDWVVSDLVDANGTRFVHISEDGIKIT